MPREGGPGGGAGAWLQKRVQTMTAALRSQACMLRALRLRQFSSRVWSVMRCAFMEDSQMPCGSHLGRTTSLRETLGSGVPSAFHLGVTAPLLPPRCP